MPIMYLGRQLGEFPVVLDGGFIYSDDLKTLVKEASSYEVRLRFCARTPEQINDFLLVFGIR